MAKFTYRPSESAEAQIKKIQEEVGIDAKSKAINYALDNILFTERDLRKLERKTNGLEEELYQIKVVISDKVQSDKKYKEMVSGLLSMGADPEYGQE